MNTIKVLHWNILAKSLAEGFDGVSYEHLDWNYRFPLVVNKIASFSPDIISLQEVEFSQFSDLKKAFLPTEWIGIYNEKIKNYDDGAVDDNHGCAMFINKKFKVHEGGFRRLIDGGSQIFSYVILSLNESDLSNRKVKFPEGKREPFLFGACHLKAKPGFENTRNRQVNTIHLCVDKLPYKRIIVGDFNDIPTSLCIENMLDKDYDVYHPEFTTHKSRNGNIVKRVIDYIFYKGINLNSAIKTLDKKYNNTLLPNKDFPSDHLPLMVYFDI